MPTPTPHPTDETKIVIIDDHDVIHTGITAWCAQAVPPIQIAGDYYNAEDFLIEHPCATDDIDVVLLDLELRSRRTDFTALENIVTGGHRVIVYSHIEHPEVILSSLDRGAAAYLVKSEGRTHLIDAVYAAKHDEPYVGPRMAAAMGNSHQDGRPHLAQREQEVLKAWFQTESKELVAKRLHIEPTTVSTHLQRVRAKYAAAGRPAPTKAALVARAVQDGIISIEDL